ncbi:MAG: TRAP transporter permease DctQ, partial [Parvibaculaceae bacterium]
RYKEVSWNSPARIQIYFFKTLIPLAAGLFIVQGVAECMRFYLAIKSNRWLPRLKDAQETEDILQAQAAATHQA